MDDKEPVEIPVRVGGDPGPVLGAVEVPPPGLKEAPEPERTPIGSGEKRSIHDVEGTWAGGQMAESRLPKDSAGVPQMSTEHEPDTTFAEAEEAHQSLVKPAAIGLTSVLVIGGIVRLISGLFGGQHDVDNPDVKKVSQPNQGQVKPGVPYPIPQEGTRADFDTLIRPYPSRSTNEFSEPGSQFKDSNSKSMPEQGVKELK